MESDKQKDTASAAQEGSGPADGKPANGKTAKAKKRDWKSWIVFVGGVGAILWGFFAAVGSGLGLWDWTSGISGVIYSSILAAVTLVIALLFFWLNRRRGSHGNRPLHWLGVLAALLYLGWMGSLFLKAAGVPAIHDVSTDLADPPAFVALSLREDNWDAIPGEDDEEMSGLNPQQRWRKLHGDAYGDIRSVRVDRPVKQVMEKAERLVEDRDWEIAALRVAEGRLEATETSSLFGYKDDIVLRVRPTQDGKGSIVDMRSVSRVGQSDLGVNAKRIRDFLADMSAE